MKQVLYIAITFLLMTNIQLKAQLYLPIDLDYFNGTVTENKVNLSWQTLSEVNSNHFILETSTDGYNYQTLITINAAGTTNLTHTYSYIHTEPNTGINYYRLSQTDNDGNYTILKTIAVNFASDENIFSVYPNPAQNYFLIQNLKVDEDQMNFSLYSTRGYLIKQCSLMPLEQCRIEKGDILAGHYFYIVTNKNNEQITRGSLIIQ